jgi:hypothetical protein
MLDTLKIRHKGFPFRMEKQAFWDYCHVLVPSVPPPFHKATKQAPKEYDPREMEAGIQACNRQKLAPFPPPLESWILILCALRVCQALVHTILSRITLTPTLTLSFGVTTCMTFSLLSNPNPNWKALVPTILSLI